MNSLDQNDKVTVHADTARQADDDSGPSVNVLRRNIVKASLASGPIIMTVTARPASAQGRGPCYGSMFDSANMAHPNNMPECDKATPHG